MPKKDTTIRVDGDTRDRLARLATLCGLPLKRVLWILSRNVEWSDVVTWNGAEVAKAAKRKKQPAGRLLVLPERERMKQQDRTLARRAAAPTAPKEDRDG